jgi:hypothetical protein
MLLRVGFHCAAVSLDSVLVNLGLSEGSVHIPADLLQAIIESSSGL